MKQSDFVAEYSVVSLARSLYTHIFVVQSVSFVHAVTEIPQTMTITNEY